jgi:hypothetical protein
VSAGCRLTDDNVTVDMGLPATLQQANAVVHFRVASVDRPRPAREAGEGFCGGSEIEVHGASVSVAKLTRALAG